ncbi:MAG: cyclic nucleotide-binding domain-containing protein [Pseudomonadota bacterium]
MADDRLDLLRQVPLFADLERKELQEIAASMKERTFRAGQEITTEGEHGVGFFVIEDGEAAVTVRGEQRTTLRRGDYFGEIALIAETDRTATVTAITDLKCLGMTFWGFRPIVESNGQLAWRLLQALAKQLHEIETHETRA